LFGGLSNTVDGTQFEPVNSLVILLFAFVGGITTITGAAIAGGLFALLNYAQTTYEELSGVVFLAVAAAAISLGRQPDGIAGMLLSGRTGGLGRRWTELRERRLQADADRPLVASAGEAGSEA
jgi:branched-chain amino acid transport system permease protein